MYLSYTQTGYKIAGEVVLQDLTTLDIPGDACVDMRDVVCIDSLSIIFIRSKAWKVTPPKLDHWSLVTNYLDRCEYKQESTNKPVTRAHAAEFFHCMWRVFGNTNVLSREVMWAQIEKIGWRTLIPMVMTGILFGVMSVSQVLKYARPYGIEAVAPEILTLAMVCQVGPGLGASMVASQCTSAVAADIAQMRVSGQWNALVAMGHDAYQCWCWPRVYACMIMTVVLVFTFVASMLVTAGFMLSRLLLNTSITEVFVQIQSALARDSGFVVLLGKSFVFGAIVSLVPIYYGHRACAAEGIGSAVNKAVYFSSVGIMVAQGLITLLML